MAQDSHDSMTTLSGLYVVFNVVFQRLHRGLKTGHHVMLHRSHGFSSRSWIRH